MKPMCSIKPASGVGCEVSFHCPNRAGHEDDPPEACFGRAMWREWASPGAIRFAWLLHFMEGVPGNRAFQGKPVVRDMAGESGSPVLGHVRMGSNEVLTQSRQTEDRRQQSWQNGRLAAKRSVTLTGPAGNTRMQESNSYDILLGGSVFDGCSPSGPCTRIHR